MSEIAVRDTDSWADMLPAVGELAGKISATSFVPKAMRGKAPEIAACILSGREIGIGPMESLQKIHVIDGRPALSAELMRSLVFKAGHEIRFPSLTDSKVTAEGRRAGSDSWTAVTWTIQDAQRIGVTGKSTWKQYPRQMLSARATAELCRLLFADAVGGISYLPEEIEDEQPVRTPTARRQPAKAEIQRPEPDLVAEPAPKVAVDQRVPEPEFDDAIVEAEIVEVSPMSATNHPMSPTNNPMSPTNNPTGDESEAGEPIPEPPTETFEQDTGDDRPKLPGGMTGPQTKMLGASMRTAGINGRTEALDFCASVIGRQIQSRNDLTKDEASRIIDVLADMNEGVINAMTALGGQPA
jgi:hypothetical protein